MITASIIMTMIITIFITTAILKALLPDEEGAPQGDPGGREEVERAEALRGPRVARGVEDHLQPYCCYCCQYYYYRLPIILRLLVV